MSRYHGPRVKIMRALGVELPGLSRKSIERRPYPPGPHGQKRNHGKLSVFGLQLKEKQKLRYNYGVSERQLRRVVKEAFRSRGNPGEKLLAILESRLDNVVFRAGYAPTIPAARQLISHGHIRIGNKKVTIPSYMVKPGEELSLSPKAKENGHVKASLEQLSLTRPTWLEWSEEQARAKVIQPPDRDSVPFPIEISMVVEYYSRRV